MHPLLDRRDLTAQRDAARQPAAAPTVDLAGVIGELATTNRLLRQLLESSRADIAQLCFSDREPPEARMENFPVAGVRRLIVRRTGAGGLYALPAAVPILVLQANENRLGGQIVNSGAQPVTLYLSADLLQPGSSAPLAAGAAQIRLLAGGSWDFQLGRALWCGSVIAVADTGGSSVSIAEV